MRLNHSYGAENMDTISTCSTRYDVDLFSPGFRRGRWRFWKKYSAKRWQFFPANTFIAAETKVISSGDVQWNSYANDTNQMGLAGITPNNGDTSIIAYQHWFSTTLAAFIQSKGHTMMGWSEFEIQAVLCPMPP